MSTSRQTTLWCDESGCSRWHMADGTPIDARREVKAMGWSRRPGGYDFCPLHNGRDIAAEDSEQSGSTTQEDNR